MLAPNSGEKTRKKLLKSAGCLRDQLTDLINKGGSLVDDAKDAASKASDQASRTVHHTMDDAKSSYDHAKSSAKKA